MKGLTMKNIVYGVVFFLFFFSHFSNATQSLQSTWIINEHQRTLTLTRNNKALLILDSLQFNFVTPTSIQVREQDEMHAVVEFVYTNVPLFTRVNASITDTVLLSIHRIDGGWHLTASPSWARHFTLFLKDLGEHFYGVVQNLIPHNHKNPDLRGSIQKVEAIGESQRYFENYSSVWSSFYFTNLGYASFFKTYAVGEYKFAINGKTELYHSTGSLDWYIFIGTNGDDIMHAYYTIIGAPKYVPAWACGPIVWRDEAKNGKTDVLTDAENFTCLRIPLSAMFIDRPYSDGNHGWSKMNFNEKFSHPEEWIKTLNTQYHLELMTWVGPASFGDSFPGSLPGHYNYFDLTNPEAVTEFNRRLNEEQYRYGVKGHKMDRAEEYFPVSEPWYDKTPVWERRNKYLFLYSKIIDSILTARWGKDHFNFARGAIHGVQPYLSAVWGGDVRASWDGMASNLANAMRCSFMGFPNWGSDVGGYLGETGIIPEQLYRRWLQWGVWCGLYEIKIDGPGGRGDDRAPWRYSHDLQESFRRACEERMEIAPYVYSLINTASEHGVLMKPLVYAYPHDSKTYTLWDEYLFGNAFLVAPILSEDLQRTVYLPEGEWYDWYTPHQSYKGKKFVTIQCHDDHIPVFVRVGSVFVTGEQWLRGNWLLWTENTDPTLVVHVFPAKKNHISTFTYIDLYDSDTRKPITVEKKNNTLTITIPPLLCTSRLEVYTLPSNAVFQLNGERIQATHKPSKNSYSISLPKGRMNFVQITLK